MKKILLILIGIVLGIAISAAFIRYRIMPFYYLVAEETGQKPFTTLVGDLHITDVGDDLYMIKSKSHPKMTVLIGHLSNQSIMSDIEVLDDAGNRFCFSDLNSDGILDGWNFSNKETLCTYGRMSGYPDTVITDGQESLVRVNGEYFPNKLVGGKNFIEKNGELVELEYVKNGYFRIK